jgi:hypothetical protein
MGPPTARAIVAPVRRCEFPAYLGSVPHQITGGSEEHWGTSP